MLFLSSPPQIRQTSAVNPFHSAKKQPKKQEGITRLSLLLKKPTTLLFKFTLTSARQRSRQLYFSLFSSLVLAVSEHRTKPCWDQAADLLFLLTPSSLSQSSIRKGRKKKFHYWCKLSAALLWPTIGQLPPPILWDSELSCEPLSFPTQIRFQLFRGREVNNNCLLLRQISSPVYMSNFFAWHEHFTSQSLFSPQMLFF